jgi:hypothetical protein
MLICVGMILRDSLLQCLLFIATIDLSITCGTAASLIYYALVMFLIYPWIKIKLKVLIFPTIQKSYCSHFSFIAGFVDALRYTSFTGANFKRWQMSHIVANCHEHVLCPRANSRENFLLRRRRNTRKSTQSFMTRWLEYLQRLCKICTPATKPQKRCGIL